MKNIPMPKGKKLFPFQEKGVLFLEATKNSYLTDEMGLGKTIQVIGLINLIKPKNILIVCPVSLKYNWQTEIEKFSTNSYKTQIVKSNSTKINDNSQILITSYGTVANGIEKYRNKNFDLIVLDESHYIKNLDAKRTKAVITLESEYKIALTGTPILNRPAEIFATVNWLKPGLLGNRRDYLERHCSLLVPNYHIRLMVESWGGAHHIEEISEKLFNSIMLRRRKSEVLTQLPPKTRQIIEVDGLKREAQKRNKILIEELTKVKDIITELEIKHYSSKEFISKLAIERHINALEKVSLCANYIIDLLESRDKIIVYAHHRDVISNLKSQLQKNKIGLVEYIGGMSDVQKDSAVQRFQNEDNVKVFIGSIRTAGVGINLTAADLVIFLELDYTPAIMLQAEDRAHRIGQKHNVLVQFFVFKNGIDSMIAHILRDKIEISNKLLRDDKTIF